MKENNTKQSWYSKVWRSVCSIFPWTESAKTARAQKIHDEAVQLSTPRERLSKLAEATQAAAKADQWKYRLEEALEGVKAKEWDKVHSTLESLPEKERTAEMKFMLARAKVEQAKEGTTVSKTELDSYKEYSEISNQNIKELSELAKTVISKIVATIIGKLGTDIAGNFPSLSEEEKNILVKELPIEANREVVDDVCKELHRDSSPEGKKRFRAFAQKAHAAGALGFVHKYQLAESLPDTKQSIELLESCLKDSDLDSAAKGQVHYKLHELVSNSQTNLEKAAEYGHPAAMQQIYEMGKLAWCRGDYQEALRLMSIPAKAGYARAQIYLGRMYQGTPTIKDPEKVFESCQKTARQNDPDGLAALGRCYELGLGVERNPEEAFKWMRQASALDPRYSGFLGKYYMEGVGTPIDLIQAKNLLETAIKVGETDEGLLVKVNTKIRLEEVRKKFEDNSVLTDEEKKFYAENVLIPPSPSERVPYSFYQLLDRYWIDGSSSSWDRWAILAARANSAGILRTMDKYRLGMYYLRPESLDRSKAFPLLHDYVATTVAEDVNKKQAIEEIYLEAKRLEKNGQRREALIKYNIAADARHPKAMYDLSVIYFNGWPEAGLPRNRAKAIELLQLAKSWLVKELADRSRLDTEQLKNAEETLNTVRQELNLHGQGGTIYAEAKRLEDSRQYKEALDKYIIAANEEYPEALYDLSVAYFTGWPEAGLAPNRAKAFDLRKQAAELGNPSAMSALAGMYIEGIETSVDLQLAESWLVKALADRSFESRHREIAQDRLKIVRERLGRAT